MKHTKLPWSYGGVNYNDWGGKYVSILEPNGVDEVVGENSLDIEDAAFIVKAVNSHEMLVEALKRVSNPHQTIHGAYVIGDDDIKAINKALAQVEE